MRKLLLLSFLCLLAFGCKKELDAQKDKFVDVIAVNIRPYPNEAYLIPGNTLQLGWYVNPSNGYVNEAEWGVYDSKVATVDQKGLVTAVGIGDTRVWLRVQPSNHIAHFYLHVVQNPVPLSSLTLSPSSLDLGVGSSGDFEVGFYPENTTQRDLVWESSDKSVAVVGADGKITGKGPGTATITVTEQNSNKKASANVTVAVPFSSITLDFPSARFLQVEERSGKSCFAIEKGITYNTSVTTKPSNSTDRLVYTVESGKESFLTVDDEGHMTGYKYGGPVTVTISSRLNDKVSTSFNVFIYDNPTGVKLDGRNVEGIGSGCSQSWYMVPVPATAYPYDSFELLGADNNLSATVRGNSLIVTADKLGDASLSTPSSKKYRTVTVKYGSYPATLRFMLCKYDPFQCKIGDGLVYHDSALCCYDGGYRGLGVIEGSAFVDNNDPPFGIIAFIGDEQLRDPFLQHTTKKMTLTYFGVTKFCIDGSTVAKLPAKVHGIAIPYNGGPFFRNFTQPLGWNGAGDGEQYMGVQKSLYDDSDMLSGITGNIQLASGGDLKYSAYMNTMAFVSYNCTATDKDYHIRPAIYFDSSILLSDYRAVFNSKLKQKYGDYYVGLKENSERVCRVCPGESLTGSYTTPWLLPTVRDLFAVFGLPGTTTFSKNTPISNANVKSNLEILANSVMNLSGKTCTYRNVYWTSNEESGTQAWAVNVGTTDLTVQSCSKYTVNKILPVLYF